MIVDFQPILKGDLVTIRPMQKSDWNAMYLAASNPLVWAGHVKQNRYKEAIFRPYFECGMSSGSAVTIIDNQTQKIIGTSRYNGYDKDRREVEIGWTFIACEYWGGLYNSEIKFLMLEHAFNFLRTVIFWVAKENLRSCRAMEKIGGVLRAGEFSKEDNGQTIPYVVYEIKKEDFLSGPLIK